jgi:DNA-binding helix-hairpin-helix protein with protein kinase domain
MLVTQAGRRVVLGRRLAAGGQGEVHDVTSHRGQVFKRYFPAVLAKDPTLPRRLVAMIANRPGQWQERGSGHMVLAWPTDIVMEGGSFAGFLMPEIDITNTVELHRVTNPTDRSTATGPSNWLTGFTWQYLVGVAANLAAATKALHETSTTVIGDFNDRNIRVSKNALVTLLDCDSMQVTDPATRERFFCRVGLREFTPPELVNADWETTVRHPSSDLYALAIHLYQLLLEGEHPFRGVWGGTGDKPAVPQLARDGIWVYGSGPLSPRPTAIDIRLLPGSTLNLFKRAFEDGARNPNRRPQAAEWYTELTALGTNLRQCRSIPTHYYFNQLSHCLWCAHGSGTRTIRVGTAQVPGPDTTVQRPMPVPKPAVPLPPPVFATTTHRRSTRRTVIARALGIVAVAVVAGMFLSNHIPWSGAGSPPPPAAGRTKVTGALTHTWSNYADADGTAGPVIPAYSSVQVSCRLTGYQVRSGNRWWYRIASPGWDNRFYASADAFYNNDQTSGSLVGGPWVDEAVPMC